MSRMNSDYIVTSQDRVFYGMLDLFTKISSFLLIEDYREFVLVCRRICNTFRYNPIVIHSPRLHSFTSQMVYNPNVIHSPYFHSFISQMVIETSSLLPLRQSHTALLSDLCRPMPYFAFEFRTDFHQPIRAHSALYKYRDDLLPFLNISVETPALDLTIIPSSVSSLTVLTEYKALHVGLLPDRLTKLNIRLKDEPLPFGVFPPNLTHLTMNSKAMFDQAFLHEIHPYNFRLLKNSLSSSDIFNQPISTGILPKSLTSLSFGENWNQTLDNGFLMELTNLKTLFFGSAFTHPIVGFLPDSLDTIIIDSLHNYPQSNFVSISKLWRTYNISFPNSGTKTDEKYQIRLDRVTESHWVRGQDEDEPVRKKQRLV